MKIETQRLLLREWQAEDIPSLVDGLNDVSVSQWLAFVPHPYTVEDAEKWIQLCIGSRNREPRDAYHFAIELRSDRAVIGGISIEKIDRDRGTAGGGLWLNKRYHGKGYAMEALTARIDFAFNDLGLKRLENGFFPGNDSSQKLQEKLGYRVEGIRRNAYRCLADGRPKDEYVTALRKEDWERLRGR